MNFFKSFLASILGTLVALLFISVLFFMSIASLATLASTEEMQPVALKSNSVLKLDLNQPIYDNVPATDEFEIAFGLKEKTFKFYDVVQAIRKAAKDENIQGIDLDSQFPQLGWSQAKALREALQAFKEEGKFIYSYGDYYSQKGYYLASVADSLFVHPMGGMELKGLAAEVLYYKDFQEKYGFKMEVVRNGKYKSAVEPYLESEMSKSNREQISSLLGAIWEAIATDIETDRGIEKAQLDALANDLVASLPEDAFAAGLLDGVIYEDQYETKLQEALSLAKDDKIAYASVSQLTQNNGLYNKGVRDRIAVIYAQGPVLYSEGSEFVIGQEVFLDAIEDAVNNRRVKAIVLRIDSPGGSALTSDILWNALMKAKKEKPLVVSMGNVAASGGYYLAAAADEIYANDFTITGSIGVFATVPNAEELASSIGINASHVQTHDNALGYSLFKSPEGHFRTKIKEGIAHVYTTFKQRVAEGRQLSMEEVEALAQGRVWSGKQALENGLIDGLGGMEQALEAAARLAEIESYNLTSYPKITPEIDDFFNLAGPFTQIDKSIKAQLPAELSMFLTRLEKKTNLPNYETRLPFSLEIK